MDMKWLCEQKRRGFGVQTESAQRRHDWEGVVMVDQR